MVPPLTARPRSWVANYLPSIEILILNKFNNLDTHSYKLQKYSRLLARLPHHYQAFHIYLPHTLHPIVRHDLSIDRTLQVL